MKAIIMNKRIVLALGMMVFVAALLISSTGAFFSDSESSVGNVFTAGDIDLKIDSTATYNGNPVTNATWTQKDLVPQSDKFFNFNDVKPGDQGENTISVHVTSNDAWVCAMVSNLTNDDNGINEPESAVDSTDGTGNGELKNSMIWTVWRDTNGDGIKDVGESVLASGHPSEGVLALYDTTTGTGPLAGNTTGFIGVAWELPATVGNEVQTDSMTGDVSFYAVQSRNNDGFKCSDTEAPTQPDTIGNDDLFTTNDRVAARLTDKWFFYNDVNDSIMPINQFTPNGANEIVAGPGGVEAARMLLDTAGSRYNIATYKFAGTPLASLTSLKYRAYDATSDSDTPYLHFNVDFNGTDTWQNRLVYVPGASTNPALPVGSWTVVDALNGGGMWCWSGMSTCGSGGATTWPTGTGTAFANNAAPYQSLSDILAAYPGIRIRVSDSWFGIRAGQPGPAAAEDYVDWVDVNGTTYDFGN